jgi:hypothetical protein
MRQADVYVCRSGARGPRGLDRLQKRRGKDSNEHGVPNEEDLPKVRRQLEEGRRFWKLAREFAEVSDELSRRKLSEAPAKAEAKKGASRRLSFPGTGRS